MSLMEIKKLLGYKVILFLILSLILGAVLPLLEFFFTIALQGLLVFLGLSQQAVTTLPEWFNVKYALPFLIALGLLRAILLGVKSYSVGAAGQEFLKLQRTKLYHFAIMKAEDLNSHEVLSLFSDTLSRSCSAILDIMTIIISGITCFLLFCGGMYTAPREMLIGLLVGSLLILPSRMIDKIVREAGKNVAEVWDLINKLLIEGMKNNFFIKVHGLEQEYEKIGRNSIEHSVSQYKRYYAYSSVKGQLSPFLGVVTIAICSYVGVMIFKTPPGKLITFIYLFMRTTQSLGEFLSSTNSFHFNKLSLM
ncbi:MAG: ABC transporter transmembrane domain-containing protein, partial [Bacteriovorax sp.]